MKAGDVVRIRSDILAKRAGQLGVVTEIIDDGAALAFTDGQMPSFQWFSRKEIDAMAKRTCNRPLYCKYDGTKLRRDGVGHYCPTRNCQWEFGVPDCTGRETDGGGA